MTPFQRVVNTFRAWDSGSDTSKDHDARQSEFCAAMREFLPKSEVPLALKVKSRVDSVSLDALNGRVTFIGEIESYDIDIASLLAEGWTTIESLEVRESYGITEPYMVVSRPATSEETARVLAEQRAMMVRLAAEQRVRAEANERAEYERLKAKFEGPR